MGSFFQSTGMYTKRHTSKNALAQSTRKLHKACAKRHAILCAQHVSFSQNLVFVWSFARACCAPAAPPFSEPAKSTCARLAQSCTRPAQRWMQPCPKRHRIFSLGQTSIVLIAPSLPPSLCQGLAQSSAQSSEKHSFAFFHQKIIRISHLMHELHVYTAKGPGYYLHRQYGSNPIIHLGGAFDCSFCSLPKLPMFQNRSQNTLEIIPPEAKNLQNQPNKPKIPKSENSEQKQTKTCENRAKTI